MSGLQGTVNPLANARNDQGAVEGGTQLTGMTMYFAPSATQKAALDALVQAQQTKGSAYYHKWLTPAEYASRFGMSASDLDKAKSWLEQQGFTVNRVNNSSTAIVFSGSVQQVDAAFGTSIHHYNVNGVTHTANATALQVPSALAGVVQTVRNISDFRPKSQHVNRTAAQAASLAKAAYTSTSTSQYYFLAPGDVSVIYDINAAYSAGYTGAGQSIAVVGQSEVELSDIENFQTAAGLTVKDPNVVLVPDSGTSIVSTGDEAESDIDLEWSGAIAKGATINFVYVGSNENYSVFDSLEYAVDDKISPIISMSYGTCETEVSASDLKELEAIMEQGASQGQSVIVSSGDSGSTACQGDTSLTTAQQEAVVVNYPASSAYATAIGGTEFEGDKSDASEYWESASGSDVVTSALRYIPEEAWNDDSSTYGLSSSGGGVSTLVQQPSWQTGVTGLPSQSGGYRYVPDISLDASNEWDPYLFCSSDTTDTEIAGSCSNGFYGSAGATYDTMTLAGGTSFGAPIFAGMVAILNQKQNSTGQGVLGPLLYPLAADSTTYASVFHDITTGNNECTAGTSYCSSTSGSETEYTTNTGYDEVTGLGTVDFYNLLSSWPASTSTSGAGTTASTTTLTAATTSPTTGTADAITITVAGAAGTPTGTLTLVVDGTQQSSTLTLSNGTATYSFTPTTAAGHVIEATYSGDATYAASSGSLSLDEPANGSMSITATNVSIAALGGSGTSTVTVTPSGGYTGTVDLTLAIDSATSSTLTTSLNNYGCYTSTSATVSGTAAVTGTITVYTSEAQCETVTAEAKTKANVSVHKFASSSAVKSAKSVPADSSRWPVGSAVALAGLLCVGMAGRRRRLIGMLGCLLVLGGIGVVSGCGGSSSTTTTTTTNTSTDAVAGTYVLDAIGADSSSGLGSSTSFTVTIN